MCGMALSTWYLTKLHENVLNVWKVVLEGWAHRRDGTITLTFL